MNQAFYNTDFPPYTPSLHSSQNPIMPTPAPKPISNTVNPLNPPGHPFLTTNGYEHNPHYLGTTMPGKTKPGQCTAGDTAELLTNLPLSNTRGMANRE